MRAPLYIAAPCLFISLSCLLSMNFSLFHRSAPRWLARAAAAVLGGYLLASAWALGWGALGPLLGVSRAEAVLAGVQWSLVLYPAAIVGAFAPISLRSVGLGLLVPAAVLAGAAVWLAGWGG